jgi:hypothetical protein
LVEKMEGNEERLRGSDALGFHDGSSDGFIGPGEVELDHPSSETAQMQRSLSNMFRHES